MFSSIKAAAENGEVCPTGPHLARICACSPQTIDNTFRDLEAEGLIEARRCGSGRQVTILATGTKTAAIVGRGKPAPAREAPASMHPRVELQPGRYVLDAEGRLHPFKHKAFVNAVVAVTVRAKTVSEPEPAPPKPRPNRTSRPEPTPPARTAETGAVVVIEPEREVDWSRSVAAHREIVPTKAAPPAAKAALICGTCSEPHESVRRAGGTCTYCRAVESAL